MARSDLLISLVRAGASGDQHMLRSVVDALAAEERAKKHTALAERLIRAMNGAVRPQPVLAATPPAAPNGRDFILERVPNRELEDLVLAPNVIAEVNGIIEEHFRADLLRSHGLQPRHRVLLAGPPGNGKTSLAEAIAEKLALPFFSVRYDTLIGSFLGETNQRLRRLFDYVRTTPCVLLFDEFDAVGKERGDSHETGEIKRLVSSLLLQMDALPSYVIVIAATNHQELLDRAVWRRFQIRVELGPPTKSQLIDYIATSLRDAVDVRSIVGRFPRHVLKIDNFAEAEDLVANIKRQHVLSGGERSIDDVFRENIELWSERLAAPLDAERPQQAITEI